MSEPKYDDREITFAETHTEMLSDLTEREREIYFSGVSEGINNAGSFFALVLVLFAAVAVATYLIFKATHQ